MNLLEDLNISSLNFYFVMIHIIHKILLLLKDHLNLLKDSVLECFFKEYCRLYFFFFLILFHKI